MHLLEKIADWNLSRSLLNLRSEECKTLYLLKSKLKFKSADWESLEFVFKMEKSASYDY